MGAASGCPRGSPFGLSEIVRCAQLGVLNILYETGEQFLRARERFASAGPGTGRASPYAHLCPVAIPNRCPTRKGAAPPAHAERYMQGEKTVDRAGKEELVTHYSGIFENAGVIVVTHYSGLSVAGY
jgi:hypothetical protein